MASSINASTSGAGGIITTADNTGILNLQTAGTNAVTVDASQNVGIGTTSPVFASGGGLSIYNATAARIKLGDSTSGIGSLDGVELIYDDDAYLFNRENTALIFGTNNAERMRIDSSGNVLVNTTTKFGSGFPAQVAIKFNDSTTQGIGLQVTGSASAADYIVFRNSSSTNIGSITRNGTTNAVLYNTTSDYRLKENITPLTNAISKVLSLKPVQWVWKDCDGAVGEGFIAHEVQEIVPNAVNGVKDEIDEEGNIKPQGMDASYLVATLTAAIQELTKRVQELEAKVN